MVQIGTVGRITAVRAGGPASPKVEPSRALVAVVPDRAEASRGHATQKARSGTRPLAGFLTQMIVSADPALRPSRLERTAAAAARYAEAARLTA